MTAEFNIKIGVRQSCILSPNLFNLYTGKIFWGIEGMKGVNISNLRYADDKVLLAEGPMDLQALLTPVNEKGKPYGMEMNIIKTKSMVVSRKILHRWPEIHNKITVIRSSFSSDSRVLNFPYTRKVLQNLTWVPADKVRRLVLRAICMSSDLDPIPTSLVKDCIDILITPITSIINLSLTEGSFPSHVKSAHVSPLLKKASLSKHSMQNYRSVSNLGFHSKVLEKVVVNQLNTHINSSTTSNQYQSAYRKFHSTETALLKIHSDILASMDAGKVTVLKIHSAILA